MLPQQPLARDAPSEVAAGLTRLRAFLAAGGELPAPSPISAHRVIAPRSNPIPIRPALFAVAEAEAELLSSKENPGRVCAVPGFVLLD
ncbi:hypothetical protein [Thiorhodovibrio frisius]|uniref:hypothetical protein n=1 Tax=Thiorhodovibrio frisius TaxID=631362 RepID=UPI000255EC20|nr:hypothetical protein [Thiorhodovibrio frisius]